MRLNKRQQAFVSQFHRVYRPFVYLSLRLHPVFTDTPYENLRYWLSQVVEPSREVERIRLRLKVEKLRGYCRKYETKIKGLESELATIDELELDLAAKCREVEQLRSHIEAAIK